MTFSLRQLAKDSKGVLKEGYESPADQPGSPPVETEIDKGDGLPVFDENRPLPVSMMGPTTVTVRAPLPVRLIRPDTYTTVRVNVGTTLRQILGNDPNRHSVIIRNLEAADGNDLYIAKAEGSPTMVIPAGDSIVLENSAAVYAAGEAALSISMLIESYENPVHFGTVVDYELR
jgi:hypothetical protein